MRALQIVAPLRVYHIINGKVVRENKKRKKAKKN